MKKVYFLNKNISELFNLIFIFSIPFLTLLLANRFDYGYRNVIIVTFLAFDVGIILNMKLFKDAFKKIETIPLIITSLLGMYIVKLWISNPNLNMEYIRETFRMITRNYIDNAYLGRVMGLFVLPSVILFLYLGFIKIYPLIIKFVKSLTKLEKKYLLIMVIGGFIVTLFLYTMTNVFYNPSYNGDLVGSDVIYTTDTGSLYDYDAYLDVNMPENDIRQPLFGLLSTPFAASAKLVSEFLFFIPNSYAILLNTFQILLLGISVIMIIRMLSLKDKDKILFIILMTCSFPFILFSFVLEQYVFSLFYLILAIYISYQEKYEVNYAYIGAVGSLLTSGLIFPLISKFNKFKTWLHNILNCLVATIYVFIITGQLLQFVNVSYKIKTLMMFTGENITFIDKIKQYFTFISSIFMAPHANTAYFMNQPRYWLNDITSFSILGLIILIICVISFIMNRKNKLAVISFLWIVFSFVLLGIVGWGASENGQILYSLYFVWAFIVLIYLFIDKIIKNERIKTIVIATLACLMLVINIQEFVRIIIFGISYYH